eukprot:1669279-Rhodomonas_salina.1
MCSRVRSRVRSRVMTRVRSRGRSRGYRKRRLTTTAPGTPGAPPTPGPGPNLKSARASDSTQPGRLLQGETPVCMRHDKTSKQSTNKGTASATQSDTRKARCLALIADQLRDRSGAALIADRS